MPEPSSERPAEAPAQPAFILTRPDGVYVNPAAIATEHDFRLFIERLFGAGFRFAGLDYPLLQRRVHQWAPSPNATAERLADAIVPFEAARRDIYKGVKITAEGEKAEYVFEPVMIESIEKSPIFGAIGDDGTAPVIAWDERRDMKPTTLDADEFVADMWLKGVRYGLDFDRVRDIIAKKETGRFEIAHMLAPVEGRDASLKEVFDGLHRDNAPKQLASGRLDLRQFNNRFPQIAKGVAIFKKVPRDFGRPGITVAGKPVEPSGKPTDFDLLALSGPGTRVDRRDDGEYIVAAMDGFLALDSQTNQVSVTEKVINTEGVSLRTTGDLSLAGDEFETQGDVQERRVVEGKHMTFHGDVYGLIESHGGNVVIDGNIVKGKANSPGGNIRVQGRASQAELRAIDGALDIQLAEGCTLIASRIRIGRAHGCTLIAEHIEADYLEGCAVAASNLVIATSHHRRDAETAVSVLIPNFAEALAREKSLADQLDKLAQSKRVLSEQLAQLRSQPELTKYIALDMKIKKGEIKLTAEQAAQALKAAQRFMPMIQKMRQLAGDIEKLKAQMTDTEAGLHDAVRQRKETAAAVGCQIKEVTGETVVRTLPLLLQEPPLSDAQIAALQPRLRNPDAGQKRLYSGTHGGFA